MTHLDKHWGHSRGIRHEELHGYVLTVPALINEGMNALRHVIRIHIEIVMMQKRCLGEDYAIRACPPNVPPSSVGELSRFGPNVNSRHEPHERPSRASPNIKSKIKLWTWNTHIVIYSKNSVRVGIGKRFESVIQTIDIMSINENLYTN